MENAEFLNELNNEAENEQVISGQEGQGNEGQNFDEESAEVLEEFEEVEYSGKKYNLPKELKGALMMQSDYTKKTQEVAEQRKTIEAEREQFAKQIESQARQNKLVARINYLDEQIAEYSKADWNALTAHDPVKAQQLFMQYSQLKDSKAQAEQEYIHAEQQYINEYNAAIARKLQDEQAILQRDIKDWSPEKAKQLSDFAVNKLGFDSKEIAQVSDSRVVKLLNMAYMADQLINKAKLKRAPTEIKPTATVSTKSASVGTKDPSKMSDKEFADWRRNQIKARK